MRKILITEINKQPVNLHAGALQNLPKDRIVLNWLIEWVEEGLKSGALAVGDLIPPKKDLAKYLGVSTGTLQNSIRYAEDSGYFKSRQCIGTMIADKTHTIPDILDEKSVSKKDAAVFGIKKFIVQNRMRKGEILPSARAIALDIETSQNTVRLALDILIRENILSEGHFGGNKPVKILNCDYKDIDFKGLKTIQAGQNSNKDKVSSVTLSEKLYLKIKDYIAENYKLNDKIMPNEDFAKLFNVSVRTVNDAMKRLNREKIVLSLRGKYGTRYIMEPNHSSKHSPAPEKSKFMSETKSVSSNIKNSYSYSWERVLDQIKKYMAGKYEAGDKLPSMKILAETLNVSTNTVRRAVNELVRQGILFCQRGKHGGIYIVEMPQKEDAYTWLALNPKFLIQ